MIVNISTTLPVRLLLSMLLLLVPCAALAAVDMENLLPPSSCGSGWKVEGKPAFYDRETLSDRINGEAELYFPYGFDRMAAARYVPRIKSSAGLDVEIYRMGSNLDAFGMYANYRQKDGRSLATGTESNLSGSQLFFYQNRHFVHIQITGSDKASANTLAECARTIAARLPGNLNRPKELASFKRPEIVKGSERYLPQSLLGYDFLNKGIMAEAVLDGKNFQIFRLLGGTTESASSTFERFRSQLTGEKIEKGESGATFLEGLDQLYGSVILIKKGTCVAGALKFSDKNGMPDLLEKICK
jgi:hypothetical protein